MLEWCQWWNSGVATTHLSGPNRNRTLAWMKIAWNVVKTRNPPKVARLKPSANNGRTTHERVHTESSGWRWAEASQSISVIEWCTLWNRHKSGTWWAARWAAYPQSSASRNASANWSAAGSPAMWWRSADGTAARRARPTTTTGTTKATLVRRLLTTKCTTSVRHPDR